MTRKASGVRARVSKRTAGGMLTADGRTSHPLYETWHAMRRRCLTTTDKEYRYYGGRGISISQEWANFWRFVEDMGPRPSPSYTVDRIDNDGPYAAWNCRWATKRQQSENSRGAKPLEYNGMRKTAADWARSLGIPRSSFRYRVRKYGLGVAIAMGMKA